VTLDLGKVDDGVMHFGPGGDRWPAIRDGRVLSSLKTLLEAGRVLPRVPAAAWNAVRRRGRPQGESMACWRIASKPARRRRRSVSASWRPRRPPRSRSASASRPAGVQVPNAAWPAPATCCGICCWVPALARPTIGHRCCVRSLLCCRLGLHDGDGSLVGAGRHCILGGVRTGHRVGADEGQRDRQSFHGQLLSRVAGQRSSIARPAPWQGGHPGARGFSLCAAPV